MQENNTSPLPEVTTIPSSEPVTIDASTPQVKPPQTKHFNIGFIFLLLLIVGSLVFIIYKQRDPIIKVITEQVPGALEVATSPTPVPTEQAVADSSLKATFSPATANIWENSERTTPELLFTKNPDTNDYSKLQAWTMNADGSNPKQTDLSEFGVAYKYPLSNLVFYTKTAKQDGFFIKNLATNVQVEVTLPQHSDPAAIEGFGLGGLDHFSPDGGYLMYNTYATTPCPTPAAVNQMQMEGGPCEATEDLKVPNGNYLLDVKTGGLTYLGKDSSTLRVSKWDTAQNAFYYVSLNYPVNHLYKIDLTTKTRNPIETNNTFGYMAYPLANDQLIRFTGETGNETSKPSQMQVSLAKPSLDPIKTIDQAGWAEIQPFARIAPNGAGFIYPRMRIVGQGHGIMSLHFYNFQTSETKQLTPAADDLSFSDYGVWVNDHIYVATVDTIEQENYTNVNNHLISIDITTGEIKYLTQQPDVYRFAIN